MAKCIGCDQETNSQVPGQIGETRGVLCDDCQFWLDGNVLSDTPAEAN